MKNVYIFVNIPLKHPIKFFRKESGRCPVKNFLDSLRGKQAQKVTWVLKLIQNRDQIPSRYWKKLKGTDDIWEARIDFAGDTFRILGFYGRDKDIILTNGFVKKTQKTPKREIQQAKKRKKQYFHT